MATWIWALISVIIVLILLWAFYNFYWLNQSQIYLVYNTAAAASGTPITFNQVDLTALRTAFGAQFATLAQLNDVGAFSCTGGFASDGTTGTPTQGYYPEWVNLPAGYQCTRAGCANGCVNNCGCNKQVNMGAPRGYWLYGPKPTPAQATTSGPAGWTVAPWSESRTEVTASGSQTIGTRQYNKYEIFGIPKII